ncbi:Tad domain-containing protein [Bdellovibrio bacteriovorus]
MLNRKSTFTQNLENQKGQVALFVALIFQVLFLFFAMVINVGLLVHHKINLQNSVDLAAYYGAMKQAEGMNTIAHVNYQIRQSWKLLAWRYRMLGTAGDFSEHPFDKISKGLKGNDDDDINAAKTDFYDAPSFCITYIPFKPMPPGENTCRDLTTKSGVKLFDVPKVFIDLPNISGKVRGLSRVLRDNATRRCEIIGGFNYTILGGFVVAFNIDQGNRMLLMSYLSRAMSPNTPKDDFFDIDGKSVHDGIEKTLKNNLTSANNTSDLKFEVYNSLGHANCNAQGVAKGSPAKWLVPIKTIPGFNYIDNSNCNSVITPVGKTLDSNPSNWPNYSKQAGGWLFEEIRELAPFIGIRNPLSDIYNYSMGVEKNPWCMAYVGVSATSQPKIPFSPFGSIALKARAFYKPFGGRIGPWYYNRWPSGAAGAKGSQGSPEERLDPNLPPRILDVANVGDPRDPTRAANYSRFIGDKIGLKSRRVMYQFGKSIFGLDPNWKVAGNGDLETQNNEIDFSDGAPNFDHWNHLPFKFADRGASLDILAWNNEQDQPSRMRELELAAVLPDAFDFAYYSIEPDFYHNYYVRLRDGFLKGPGAGYAAEKELMGDIGMHRGYNQGGVNYDKFSVKDQFTVVKNSAHLGATVDISSKLTYLAQKWEHALTGWAPVNLMNYGLDTAKFGKCDARPLGADNNDPKPANPGNCVVGGTTGYSVKMVSSDYLRSNDLNLGGEGVNGPLLNPPPNEDEF